MPIFKVWDEYNGTEEEAKEIEAASEGEAVVQFGKTDSDGWMDGCYFPNPHTIMVRNRLGRLSKYNVWAEVEYVWRRNCIEDDINETQVCIRSPAR